MAKQRRGGFSPPELRGTLGTLLRTTFQQAGIVRDAIERGARSGRARLDDLRADRERHDALAELGGLVLELIRNGEIDLGELPEAEPIVARLDQLDESDDQAEQPVRRLRPRARFDAREERDARDDRADRDDRESRGDKRRAARDDDDDTVSAATWRPPARRPGKPTNVWRPPTAQPTPPASDETVGEPAAKQARAKPRKGGITFDDPSDDSDLAEYMHPDDVPPKK